MQRWRGKGFLTSKALSISIIFVFDCRLENSNYLACSNPIGSLLQLYGIKKHLTSLLAINKSTRNSSGCQDLVSKTQNSFYFTKLTYSNITNRALFCDKACKEVTRAQKCRVNRSRRRVLLPTSWVLSSLPWVLCHRTKHGFGFFICFII